MIILYKITGLNKTSAGSQIEKQCLSLAIKPTIVQKLVLRVRPALLILCNVSHIRTLYSLLQHNAGHSTGVAIKRVFCVIIQAQEGFMRCFIFKETCLSLSMAFRAARIHSLRPKALQTSLRLKQSDPNSLLALSSHTAMICKLFTTYF